MAYSIKDGEQDRATVTHVYCNTEWWAFDLLSSQPASEQSVYTIADDQDSVVNESKFHRVLRVTLYIIPQRHINESFKC